MLNRSPPPTIPDIPPASELIQVNTCPPTKAEVIKAIKKIKNGKAAGPDGIPQEAIKTEPSTTAEMLPPLLLKIWEQEQVPANWKLGYLANIKGDLS